MTNDQGCLSFYWRADVLKPIDKSYLALCAIPLISLVMIFWSTFSESCILSRIIIYANKKSETRLLKQFKKEIRA